MHDPYIDQIELLDDSIDEAQSLAIAGALQQHSSHPFARAFPPSHLSAEKVEIVAGQGVKAEVGEQQVKIGSAAFIEFAAANELDRSVYLAINDRAVARYELSNQTRNDAAASIGAIRSLGIDTLMLSGDSPARCEEIATELAIDYLARQTPESKLDAIRHAQSAGARVLMVGDGINDVPVLAGADVSAAVVEASDLVKSKADVLLLNRKLSPLVDLLMIARRTQRVVRQNLCWALAYNLTAIPLAALGLVAPWLAAVGMASSSTLVMLNATRLLNSSEKPVAGI